MTEMCQLQGDPVPEEFTLVPASSPAVLLLRGKPGFDGKENFQTRTFDSQDLSRISTLSAEKHAICFKGRASVGD